MGLCYFKREDQGFVFLNICPILDLYYEPVCRALIGSLGNDEDEVVVIQNVSLEEAEPLMEQYFRNGKIDLHDYTAEVMNPNEMWDFTIKHWGPEVKRMFGEHRISDKAKK